MRGERAATTLFPVTTPTKETGMPRISANGIELGYDLSGTGETLVLVHGSWSDRNNWLPVVSELARTFRVVAYDRRGNGLSTRDVPASRRDHEDDLAALIEGVSGEPAHVVGTSFGASIALGLASRRPELLQSVVAHEPPLVSLVAGDPEVRAEVELVQASVAAVLAHIGRGETTAAAEQFVEEVALGPGTWKLLPQPLRETMIDSAAAFVVEQADPMWANVDLEALASISTPILLTEGDESPAWFAPIVATLADAIGHAEVHTYHGAGHAPHQTHPDDYLAVVPEWLSRVSAGRGLPAGAMAG